MFCYTDLKVMMEDARKAEEALNIMKDTIAKTEAPDEETKSAMEWLAASLTIDDPEILANMACGVRNDTDRFIFPIIFKAVATAFLYSKFTATAYYYHSNEEENFDISYEDGELVIESLYHSNDEEPYCPDCEDCYEYFEEDGIAGYRCASCGKMISVEEFNETCERSYKNIYEI